MEEQDELEQLRRWKAEAMEVIAGLQELGKALQMRPGQRITGPEAVLAADALRAERDSLRAECGALRAERNALQAAARQRP